MKKNVKLDKYEQEIEKSSDEYVPVSDVKKKKIESILTDSRKSRNINIRIKNYDLELIRKRAEEEGIPYQTLIASIIHKYISNQLIEERDIYNAIKILQK
jgi:predicted DNA binding CopG/RHH family protein